MEENIQKLTLSRPAVYEIKVPGILDEMYLDMVDQMMLTFDTNEQGLPFTTLTGAVDQAGLQGLLRRLYALGLPLLSVTCVDFLETH